MKHMKHGKPHFIHRARASFSVVHLSSTGNIASASQSKQNHFESVFVFRSACIEACS